MPRTPKPAQPVPEPAQALADIASAETIVKGARVFVDVDGVPRVPAPDGRIVAVQREKRADGSVGPMMLAFVRVAPDRTENATRYPLADIQAATDAFAGKGIPLVRA